MADPAASRARIVDTARRLVLADGVEALSMRKLAAEIGLAPTAIYWHVGGRKELLNAVLDDLVAELAPIEASGTDARARISSVVRAARREFLDGMHTLQLATALGRGNEMSFRAQVALARELALVGVDGAEAANVLRALMFLVGGFVMIEDEYRQRAPGEMATGQLWAELDDGAVDPELRSEMAGPTDTDALFEFTLGRLLDGVLGPSPA